MIGSATELLVERFRSSWRDVLLVTSEDVRLTYADVWSHARRIVEDWHAAGVRRGDHVALLLPNSPGFVCAYVACIIGGFVAAPINPELPEPDVEHILGMLAPRLIVREPPRLSAFEMAMATDIASRDEEVCAIFFTSGTTGTPKGVRHTPASLIGNVASFNNMMGIDADARMYHVLPMAYMAGFLNTVLSPLIAGGSVILGPRFSARSALSFWERPARHRANVMWVTPSIAAALCRAVRDLEGARKAAAGIRVMCGTAPLHDAIRDRFAAAFGVPLQESYGTSELLLVAAQGHEDATRERDVGTMLPEVEARLRANSEGQTELVLKSPFAFAGYLTSQGIVPPESYEGFYGTGDVAEIADRRLKITGRIKDLIIRGGVNVAPAAVENALAGMEGVSDVAVIGVPHEFWGEAIVVCVESSADQERIAAEVRARCRERLGRMQQPDRIEIVQSFPRTVTGKVQKNKLRAMFVQ